MKTFTSIVTVLSVLCTATHALSSEPNGVVYLSNLDQCEPAAALSKTAQQAKWKLISYQTENISGTMIGAGSYVEAPEVQLPIKQQGWYSVNLGIWNPSIMYDGKPIVKARLSSRPIFQQLHPGSSPGTQDATFLEEVHLTNADLTEEKYIAFSKANGLQPRSAYIAYVKLTPLSAEQISAEKARRKNKDRKNLVATFDGTSIFHFSDCTTTDHLLEWVEKLRHSDTKKVLWAVTYGDRTGFPTANPDLTYLGAEHLFLPSTLPFANNYQRGERQMQQFFKMCADKKIVPQQLLAEHSHQQGMKFDLMYRLGILGGVGMMQLHNQNFVQKHPEVRQVTHDGIVLQKASFAFNKVQQMVLQQIEESCQQIDADGINLCFVRGPHFLLWEKPVRMAFEKQYGISSDGIEEDDPRIDTVRAKIMTHFMQQVRAKLDQLGKARGREFTLSAWVWPHKQNVWLGGRPIDEGLDVQQWIKLGLLDSVICQEGIDGSYRELGEKHNCEFVLYTGYRGEKAMSPTSIVAAQKKGVNSFACWDIDAYQNHPETWHWLRQTGNQQALSQFIKNPKLLDRMRVQLQTINNYRVNKGLADAVYSGG